MKVIYEGILNGQTTVLNATVANGYEGLFVKTRPGPGKPFFCWPSLPPTGGSKVIAADFTNAPIATNDTTQNNALIATFQASGVAPEDVLTWDPPYP